MARVFMLTLNPCSGKCRVEGSTREREARFVAAGQELRLPRQK